MQSQRLGKAVRILLLIILIVIVLVYGKPFLVPLTFAAILSMLLSPVANWLRRKGIGKVGATLLSILVLIVAAGLIISFISWQVSGLGSDFSHIEKQLVLKADQLKSVITEKLGIPPERQKELIKGQQEATTNGVSSMITGFIAGIGGFITDVILVLVYIFLFIFYRSHLKNFLVRIVPDKNEEEAIIIINKSQHVAQKYLTGLSLMILCLWVMYSIGFSIVGVKNAVFFAVLCGLLEIVPFVGNLLGTAITVGMSLVQGADTDMVIGILLTYGLVQFLQTYILEPLVVGAEVSINPLFTIIGLVAGEMLWGIAGMVLALPVLGITKIVCENIESLKPIGFLIGENKKQGTSSFSQKVKGFLKFSKTGK